MAHWIIDDRGFGGVTYTCSNCWDIWCDLFDDHSLDHCDTCGEPIDEEASVYVIDNKSKPGRPVKVKRRVKKKNEFECNRCGIIFDPDETLDAYEELGHMIYVNRFDGDNPYQPKGNIIPLCHDCTMELNEFVYGEE